MPPCFVAAAVSSCWRAVAAATRSGSYSACIVFEPPVTWLNPSSGRASARVIRTRSTGTSSSSAMTIAQAVVIPWPVSARGRSNVTVPSVSIRTVSRWNVAVATSVSWSLMSKRSPGWGEGIGVACAGVARVPAAAMRTWPASR